MPKFAKAELIAGTQLGDRILKVDHAGENGAVCIYAAQRFVARWRLPRMVGELDEFLVHERHHRALFGAELAARGRARCRSYRLCGLGGALLGVLTGLAGEQAILATTVAVERVVLRHLHEQLLVLRDADPGACSIIRAIIGDEQEHHDRTAARLNVTGFWPRILDPLVSVSTEAVIWLGMEL